MTFALFWAAYPRKVGKSAALRAYAKAIRETSEGCILEAAQAYAERWAATQTAAAFIPHPSTWLNQERFNDDPAVAIPDKPARQGPGANASAGRRAILAEIDGMERGEAGAGTLDLSGDSIPWPD